MDGDRTPTLTAPGPAELAELQDLYDRTQLADAWLRAAAYSPVESWSERDAAILAGRLLSNWGDIVASDRVHWRNFRRHPESTAALVYAGYSKVRRHGPFEALRWLEELPARPAPTGADKDHAHFLSLRAVQYAQFRDLETAHRLLNEAEHFSPDDPWLACERSEVLLSEDRYDEAVLAARRALELRPWYRPGVERLAHLLQLRSGEEEALALLNEACTRLQSGYLRIARFRLLRELGHFVEAGATLDGLERFLPRMPKGYREWLAGVRADLAYREGRHADAAQLASAAKGAYYERMAARLAAPASGLRRVELPVPFVRQHHMTCAPATLSAIARFLGAEVDHLALAARITYDGTPDHEERHWAESLGWTAREFRVTWESAVALIDRGLPFTLTTVATRSAHLQAVVGYDAILGTLLIRDPYQREQREALAEELLKEQSAYGPRGMVLLPPSHHGRLDGLELPDAVPFDHWYWLRRALHVHDRARGDTETAALASLDPEHRLTLWAQRELAMYDGRAAAQLTLNRRLLERHPEDANLQLAEVALLRRLGRTEELRDVLAHRALHRSADVLLRLEHVSQLADDAPRAERTIRLAWRLLHWHPVDGAVLRVCANVLWERREVTRAVRVYRLAATVAVSHEDHWRSYFIASRHAGETDRALAELRRRHETLGRASPWPSCSLFNALDLLERTAEGFAVLDEAIARRPDDADLRLFAARKRANYGDAARAKELLDAVAGRSRRIDWLRAAATVARCEINHAAALAHWQEVLAIEPLDTEAQGETARLLAICSGRDATLVHLRAAVERHPFFVPLHTLLIEWLRRGTTAERLAAVDALLARDADNAWALRERALLRLEEQHFAEALADAETARRLDPHAAPSAGIVGDILAAQGRWDEARAEYERALRLQIGAEHWFGRLLSACRTDEQRRAAVDFLDQQARSQHWADEAPLPFQATARTVLTVDELAQRLDSLRRARPGQWQCWAAHAIHLRQSGRHPEAVQILESAVEKFPVLPRLWLELGISHLQRGSLPSAITAIEKARSLAPGWTIPYARLGLAYEALLQLDDAARILRLGIAADPADAGLRGQLADVDWKLGRRTEAVAEMERTLFLEPEISWAWERLHVWHRDLGRADGALGTVQSLLQARPGDAGVWVRLARLQSEVGSLEDAVQSTIEATRRDSRYVLAYDLRAELLARLGRLDEARDACTPSALAALECHELGGRAAWLENVRGHQVRAIEAMRALVAKHPDYYWGWEQLCIWHGERAAHDEAFAAAERLVWLNPNAGVPYAYRAVAELALKRRAAAKESLRLALQREPDYLWAAHRLLALLVEDSELVEAEKVLALVRTHGPGPAALRAELRVHRAAGRRDEARRCLTELARLPAHRTEELARAVQDLLDAGWRDELRETTASLLGEAGINAEIGSAWVRSWLDGARWWPIRRVLRKDVAPEVADTAWTALLEHLGEQRAIWTLRLLRTLFARPLRERTSRWGAMGYALVTAKAYGESVRWLGDYARRPDLAPWMLLNHSIALIARRRWDDLAPALDVALQKTPDHVRRPLLAMRAFSAARAGDIALARRLLGEVAPDGLRALSACCRASAEALVELQGDATKSPIDLQAHFQRHEQLSGGFAQDPLAAIVREEYTKAAARLDGQPKRWRKERRRMASTATPPPAAPAAPNDGTKIWPFMILLIVLLRLLASLGQ